MKRGFGSAARIAGWIAAGVVVLVAASALVLVLHYRSWLERPVLQAGEERMITIERGTIWPRIVKVLEREDLVRRPLYFEYWARKRALPENAKAGTYILEGPMSLRDLDAALRRGGLLEEVEVTLLEGWTIFHIAEALENAGVLDREAFLAAARDADELRSAGIPGESFEGYLFPDTYRFFRGMRGRDVVDRLHDRWLDVWQDVVRAHPGALAANADVLPDRHARVTLASIVEKETGVAEEAPTVARVFLNRLERDMPLQTDPTCVYGEESYDDVPTPAHCKDPLNRYSTYVIDGLPPGPIANPGKNALRAVLRPDPSEEAKRLLFFVARRDGSGRHDFSETFREHRKKIRRYLR